MEATDYQWILARFKQRRDESSVLLPILDLLVEEEKSLKEAETCLSIGPGAGQNDLDFLRRCLPNLKKYVAVDKKADSLDLLRVNFRSIYGDSVEYLDSQADAATWSMPGDEKVDVVWMSHMLYCIPETDRLLIFGNLLGKILRPGTGVVLVVNNAEGNVFQRLHEQLRIRPLLTSGEIKRDFERAGGVVTWSREYSCDFDASEYDEDLRYYLMEFSDRPLTPAEIMEAVEVVAPAGRSAYRCEIFKVKNK